MKYKKYVFVRNDVWCRTDVLLIGYHYLDGGAVLELLYKADGLEYTEEEIYERFVDAISEAVEDGVLPVTLSRYHWWSWESINEGKHPRQYSVVRDTVDFITMSWKSTFVKNFWYAGEE